MSENFDRLDELIPRYALNKAELDSYKKICEKENAEIKAIMEDLVLSKYETDNYKVVRSVQKRSKMDEETLLMILSSSPALADIAYANQIIKSKPYVDFDALENAIYKGKFLEEQLLELNRATETKEVVTLRITKKKEKK